MEFLLGGIFVYGVATGLYWFKHGGKLKDALLWPKSLV